MSHFMAREILEREFAIDGTDCHVAPVATGGFSGARVFEVHSGPHRLALRQWPRETLPVKRILALHRWLNYLAVDCELPVAAPLATRDGRTCVESHGDLWHLEPWLPGTPDWGSSSAERRERIQLVMPVIARLHHQSARYPSPASEQPWFGTSPADSSPAIQERLVLLTDMDPETIGVLAGEVRNSFSEDSPETARLNQWLDRFLPAYPRRRHLMLGELSQLVGARVALQPVWRDLWSDHVLFDGARVGGLIDGTAARTESVASDLSRLLGSLAGLDANGWQEALESYDAVRRLSLEERLLVRALDRSSMLMSPATWLRRLARPKPQSVVGPEQLHRILGRIERFSDRLEQDFDGNTGLLL